MNTQLEAYKINEQVRGSQLQQVFGCLYAQYLAGYPITVEQISHFTGIKITTVHARINDLRASGWFKDDILFKPIEAGSVKKGRYHYNLYTIAESKEVDLKEMQIELERIEKKLKRNFAKRKKIKQRIFDHVNKPPLL